MFNLKKHAQSIELNYDEMLEAQTAADDLSVDGSLIKEKALDEIRSNTDIIDTTEVQLDETREKLSSMTLEEKLNTTKGTFNKLRDNRNEGGNVLPLDLLNEAHEQAWLKKVKESGSHDTGFWDQYVNTEMVGKKTKQINKMGPSQLQNVADRFSELTPEPDSIYPDNVKKMITASLMDADAMLFHIFFKAAGRDLTADEQKLVDGITKDKIRILSQVTPKHSVRALHDQLNRMSSQGVPHTDPQFEETLAAYHEALEGLRPSIEGQQSGVDAFPR